MSTKAVITNLRKGKSSARREYMVKYYLNGVLPRTVRGG